MNIKLKTLLLKLYYILFQNTKEHRYNIYSNYSIFFKIKKIKKFKKL